MPITKTTNQVITTPVQSALTANIATTADRITNPNYNGFGIKTISTSAPPVGVGSEGDIWYQY